MITKRIKKSTFGLMATMFLVIFGMGKEGVSAEKIFNIMEEHEEGEMNKEIEEKLRSTSPVPKPYSVNGVANEEKKSGLVEKESPHSYASVSVNGITYGYSTVYVWVKSNNGAYISKTLQCTSNYPDLRNLDYICYSGEKFDSDDAKGRNFCVYVKYDASSRITSGKISGEVIP